MKKIFFLLTLSLNFFFLNGQSTLPGGFLKGYILTNKDTIHCYVYNKYFFKDCEVVKYKFSKDDQVKEIYIDNIVEIRDNELLYRKLVLNKKAFIAIQIINGPVSLYTVNPTYQMVGGYHYNYQHDNKGVYYLGKSDEVVRIEKNSYKESLKSILTGDPETTKKIDELANYSDVYTYIKALVNNYNAKLKTQGK